MWLSRLIKFKSLKWELKKAVFWAFLLLIAVRIGFLILPFHRVQYILNFISSRPLDDIRHNLDLEEIAWAVRAAGSCLPATTCLTRALTTKVLLAWRGEASTLLIGVAKDEENMLKAHAWLKREGKIVIGGDGIDCYKTFPAFDEVN